MAAIDIQIPAPLAEHLTERLEEEIARAERLQTPLSCILIGVADPRAIERAHSRELAQQTRAYLGLALRGDVRRYDRVGATSNGDCLLVLPGVDGARGELVARRALARLRAVKLQGSHGEREALALTAGLVTWRAGATAQELIAAASAAAGRQREQGHSTRPSVSPPLPQGALGLADALRV